MTQRKTSRISPGTLETCSDIIRGCVKAIENGTEDQFTESFGTDPLQSLLNIAGLLETVAGSRPEPKQYQEVEDPACFPERVSE